ncbi:uncharacterized protein [Apostichopus japonicus]|uniref:uncharacterized protein n=1 Tax=Stichopus japonicus TaxID=307972 RepID=UPI003AB75E0A
MASPVDAMIMQEDLYRLKGWSTEWHMLFNPGKCKCLHARRKNMHYDYYMGDTCITSINEEKDLGVLITASMSQSQQYAKAVKTANQVLGMIKRSICYKEQDILIRLYKSLVRPHLEYAIQAWCPYLLKEIVLLENVHRRFTKMIPGLHHLRYEQRLKKSQESHFT